MSGLFPRGHPLPSLAGFPAGAGMGNADAVEPTSSKPTYGAAVPQADSRPLGKPLSTWASHPTCLATRAESADIATKQQKLVQDFLGHADPRMTSRYAHVVDMAKRNPALFIPVKVG